MDKLSLAKWVYETAHLTGTFKLRSGQTSHEYFDKYRLEANPKLLKEIAIALKNLIPSGTEVLAGLEMGGIPIATALSLETGIPAAFVRKKAKDYGTCLISEGSDIKNKNVCIIEDVVTTGGQVLLSSQDLKNAGALIKNVICVIHRADIINPGFREHNLNLIPLFEKKDFNF